jgi:hypothetical protein
LLSFLAILESDSGAPTTYVTFNADYDALESANLLEIIRAIIYNYLIAIGMPITSDVTVTKGLKMKSPLIIVYL